MGGWRSLVDLIIPASRPEYSPSGSLGKKTTADQIRFVNILDGSFLFADGHRDGLDPNRLSFGTSDRLQDPPIEGIEPIGVDPQPAQSIVGGSLIDLCLPLHLDKVTDPLEISIGDPRCPAATTGERFGTLAGHIEVENPRTSKENIDDLVIIIQLEFFLNSKSSSKGCGQIAFSSGGSDQRETRQMDPHRACVGARIDDDVDLEVFHGGVEVFLDHPADAVYLIDEEHIALFQFGQ